MEVLIAVAIIGIISAIAVPQFTAQKDKAARVAGDTTVSNILKAFNSCMVLNNFATVQYLSWHRGYLPRLPCEKKILEIQSFVHIYLKAEHQQKNLQLVYL